MKHRKELMIQTSTLFTIYVYGWTEVFDTRFTLITEGDWKPAEDGGKEKEITFAYDDSVYAAPLRMRPCEKDTPMQEQFYWDEFVKAKLKDKIHV